MKKILLLGFLLFTVIFGEAQTIKVKEPVNFLALGDSYTIGQSVGVNERWPKQLITGLSNLGYATGELKIIAQTGWRTDNLQNAINQQLPLSGYSLVSLLIGVNNQFQGGNIQTYAIEFEALLVQAISLAGNNPSHVFVLSIPDYAFTPYGNGNPSISSQIDEFNNVNRLITSNYNVKYIDITPISRRGLAEPALVATDGLHPSGAMYALWVQEIIKSMEKEVGIHDEFSGAGEVSYILKDRQLLLTNIDDAAEVLIYSIRGELVIQDNSSADSGSVFNLNGLANGIYFVLVRGRTGVVSRMKILLH